MLAASRLLCSLSQRSQGLGLTLAGGIAILVGGCSGVTSTPAVVRAAAITITGPAETRLGQSAQFTASLSAGSSAFTWAVNGANGGTAASGTITSTGLYTAPAMLPTPNVITISAGSVSAAAPGTLTDTILNPVPAITAAVAALQASGTYTIDVSGAGFLSGALIQIAGASVPTSFVSSTELTASVLVASGTTSIGVDVVNPMSGGTPSTIAQAEIASVLPTAPVAASVAAAARLLDQATFGPTLADIAHVQQVGLDAYITEQFKVAPTLLADIPATPTSVCTNNVTALCEQSEWWRTVLTGPDQLRQRIAFALSEIFVVSTDSVNPRAVTPYHNMLAKDAFTNYATIMKDVSLSPAMGAYLNMLNSNKPAPGQIANENYPRELMQLFTTGTDLLNQDGSLRLDTNHNQIPVYTELQVQAFARAYTGWTYANSTGGAAVKLPNVTPNFYAPMAAVESAHDTTAKTLLGNTILPSGQSAEQDLDGALASIFNHPNVGPFVCRQLIQHLVAGNPSPAYVARVSSVFANNGNGVRGDMQAVIRAILEDPEARAGDTDPEFDSGHLREAMLYLANILRGLGFTNTSSVGDYSNLSNYTSPLGEKPYNAGSVFNFFPPDYVIPGGTITAPEFAQENTASAVLRLTLADEIVNNRISKFNVDLSATSVLGQMASKTGVAASDAGNLVDSLGLIFMHGQMPANVRSEIVNHVATLANIGERVRVAVYLVITASQYKIEN
jgi:uncharacterized protein (DUF1800 family)